MSNNQARDLFQLQSELVDMKVDMAVSKAIDRVIQEITGLRIEMHKDIRDLRTDMDKQFSVLGQRVTSVESAISFMRETQSKISSKLIDYTFKAIWLILGSAILYVFANFIKLLLM